MTNLCHRKYSKCPCGSKTGLETPAPLVHCIVYNAVFRISLNVNQMLHRIIDILHFCVVVLMVSNAADCVVNWIEVRTVQRPHSTKSIEAIDLDFYGGGGGGE